MNTIPSLQKINNRLIYFDKRHISKLFFLLLTSLFLAKAHSQMDQRLMLADQYFTAGEYVTAASLYGQFLNPPASAKPVSDFPLNSKKSGIGRTGAYHTKTDILLKQAESYRLANYWIEAAALYKTSFEKDSSKYADAIYWYAVCQRSMGNYLAAEENIDVFLKTYAAGSTYQQAAENEKQTLQFIKKQLSCPDSILYHAKRLNTFFGIDRGVFAPVATSANQFIITSTEKDSVTAGTNPYHNRLFHTSNTDDSLVHFDPIIIEGADVSLNQGAATISADGKYLYFTQWKKENGKVVSSIYYATKTANGWGHPTLLTSINQQGHNSKQPFCTPDGKYLFFASDRTGGYGNFDIWYAVLNADGTTTEPVNAGSVLNSAANEQAPFYHTATSTLVFSSDRLPGMGGYDLFTAKGGEASWKVPENMGYPVNSSRDDIYFFTAEKTALLKNFLLSSDRGSECCLATYAVSKTPKKRIITGVIRDCKDDQPVADAIVVLRDPSGKMIQTVSDTEGKYSYELGNEASLGQLIINKEKYIEKTADIQVATTNETNWQTDTLYNSALCIEKKPLIKVENVVSVYFDFDRSQLTDRAKTQLDSIYQVLVNDSIATIQISGYTDGLGSAKYNKILSDKRAKACADYLIEKGVAQNRISFESFGSCCPVEMEMINGRDNPDGRSMNRRALININKE